MIRGCVVALFFHFDVSILFRTRFMFILTRLTDTVKLLPSTEYSHTAVTQWLNAKYSNKVLHKTGLCIAVYDILSVGDGALKYGDGCVYIKSTSSGNVVLTL